MCAEWPHEHVMAAFRRCLFAVLPSICLDACPTTVLEAMASGRPVVATTTGGIVDMIVDGENGLLVPPGDEHKLAEAMARLLNDADLRVRLAAGARNASSGSRHPPSWSASKPFTRGSLREILGRLQKAARRASTDETLTDHDSDGLRKASGNRGDQTLERPLRVLMVCPRYLPEFGGTEMHVHEVTRRLSALGGFEITVLTTDRSRRLPRRRGR